MLAIHALLLTTLAGADPLAILQQEMGPGLASGQPIVVFAHVPLCDNRILRCGGGRLGDGDDPSGNLYWATSGGFLGWFGRRGSGWRPVEGRVTGTPADILAVRIWRRRVAAGPAWRKLGVRDVTVYVVAQAWRGTAIDAALAEFLHDVTRGPARDVVLADGTPLPPASSIAWVGHNRMLDVQAPDWEALARQADGRTRGVIAVACHTYATMAGLAAPTRVPLLYTRDFLFAGAHSFEGAVTAFARGDDLAGIRRAAIDAYARGQGKPAARVGGAFTNPSDRRWR